MTVSERITDVREVREAPALSRLPADRKDLLFALLYLAVGYGFIYTFTSGYFGRNLAVFTVLYVTVVLAYVLKKGGKLTTEGAFWACVVLGIGIPGAFWSIMPFLQVLALMTAAAYWTLAVSGRLLEEGRSSRWIFFDLLNAGLLVPFSNFGCQLRVMLQSGSAETERDASERSDFGNRLRSAAGIGCGLLLAVPVLMIVLPLLAGADAGFEAVLQNITAYLSDHVLLTICRFLFSLPVSAYLFGLAYGSVHGRRTDRIVREQVREAGKQARLLPDVTVYTVLGLVCFVYSAFLCLQASYLFSAFAGIRPEGFTYAEYARRGFFELCAAALFNLCILLCGELVSRHRREENAGLRCLSAIMAALTLVLIATAMSKLAMYMGVYGLTVNRILPMTFMIWMVVVYVCLILRQWKTFPAARICIMTGAVLFVLLCVFPVEDGVQAYNSWARAAGLIP